MSAKVAPLEVVVTTAPADDDAVHFVCHCTNDNRSACGLDVTTAELRRDWSDDEDCPLCVLAWPDGAPECPWGCRCEECAP